MDEGLGGVYMVNQVAGLPDPLATIVVYDEAIWSGPAGRGHIVPANPCLVEGGAKIHQAHDLRIARRRVEPPGGNARENGRGIQRRGGSRADRASGAAAHHRYRQGVPDRAAAVLRVSPVRGHHLHHGRNRGGRHGTRAERAQPADSRAVCGGVLRRAAWTAGRNAGYVGGLAKAAATGLRTADHLVATLQTAG